MISTRLLIVMATAVAAAVAVVLYGPVSQPSGYSSFADERSIWGVPNFWNVVSNIPFLVVGLIGTAELGRQLPQGALAALKLSYLSFFAGTVLVAVGSAYYHLDPTNQTLVWDRLPMTIVFMAFFSVIIGEHISLRIGRALLFPLLALGVISVANWSITETAGRGDLRLYIIVQYLPMILIPLILLFFPSRFSHAHLLWIVLGAYGLAKLFEMADRQVFSLFHVVSGHTLKHLVAALGMYAFLYAVRHRRFAGVNP